MAKKTKAAGEQFDPRLKLFRLDANALTLWEENTGRTYDQIDPKSMKDFRMLMWCGLKTQILDITIEQVGSMLTMQSGQAIKAIIDELTAKAKGAGKNGSARPIG